MHLTRLEVVNFKRVKTATITPDGSIVPLRGNNGQGKSSVIDSLAALFGGEKLCPKDPIHGNEKEATIIGRLDSYEDFGPIIGERTFRLRDDGTVTSTLKLTAETNGVKLDKPQRRLDELIGSLSFDPLAFLREKPERQAEILRQVAGVDLSLFEGRRLRIYDARTAVNRELAAAKARLQSIPLVVAPDEEFSAADLLEEQNRRQELAAGIESKRLELRQTGSDFNDAKDAVQSAKNHIEKIKVDIQRLEKLLAEGRESLATKEKELEEIREAGKKLKEEVAALVDPDMAEIPTKLRDVDEKNRLVRQKKERMVIAGQLSELEGREAEMTDQIKKVDEEKQQALAAVKLPVEGLSFTAEGVVLKGRPFEQASQAEQLCVSAAMAMAMNPKLPIMLIRDGSLLDSKSLAMLAAMAEKANAQVWIEIVGKDGSGIVIEDGLVESTPAPKKVANG